MMLCLDKIASRAVTCQNRSPARLQPAGTTRSNAAKKYTQVNAMQSQPLFGAMTRIMYGINSLKIEERKDKNNNLSTAFHKITVRKVHFNQITFESIFFGAVHYILNFLTKIY